LYFPYNPQRTIVQRPFVPNAHTPAFGSPSQEGIRTNRTTANGSRFTSFDPSMDVFLVSISRAFGFSVLVIYNVVHAPVDGRSLPLGKRWTMDQASALDVFFALVGSHLLHFRWTMNVVVSFFHSTYHSHNPGNR
jgi:hypothetical protein